MTIRYIGMSRETGRAITDVEHIRQSCGDILRTPVGSRVMRRDYGSLLFSLIDQPQTDALKLQIMCACYMALLKWEPRISISALTVAGKGCTLAYAANNDLDVMAGNNNTARQTVIPADDSTIPPTPAVMESDTDLRFRAQQAYEGLSVAGPVGAYEYHGRSADGRVADISVVSPSPACVTITVLSREDDGTASNDLLAVVEKALNAEEVRPVGDRVTVQSAEIVPYQIDATLYFYPGPEAEPIRQAAEEKLKAYISAQQRLGRDIRQSAIYAALHVEGVQRVELAAPLADIVLTQYQASYCTEYSIADGGADE